jgi:hypothetical protein
MSVVVVLKDRKSGISVERDRKSGIVVVRDTKSGIVAVRDESCGTVVVRYRKSGTVVVRNKGISIVNGMGDESPVRAGRVSVVQGRLTLVAHEIWLVHGTHDREGT